MTDHPQPVEQVKHDVEKAGQPLGALVEALPGLLDKWESAVDKAGEKDAHWAPEVWAAGAAVLTHIDLVDQTLKDRTKEIRTALKTMRKWAAPIVSESQQRFEATKAAQAQ